MQVSFFTFTTVVTFHDKMEEGPASMSYLSSIGLGVAMENELTVKPLFVYSAF